jgi:hypothetical protein
VSGPAPRVPWPGELGEVIVHHPARRDLQGRWRQPAFDHPHYVAAKAGDADAADRYTATFLDSQSLDRLRRLTATRPCRVLAVHAEERTGRNAIPEAMATKLAAACGVPVDATIVQSNRPYRTRASGLERFAHRVWFDGVVEPDLYYLLVDDHVTVGGTLADLASHVVAGGGHVLAATTLTSARDTALLALSERRLAEVRGRFGRLEPRFIEAFGYGFEALTNGEAAILLQQSTLEFG